jgi:DNA-binding transcriptional MerR regulator
MKMRDLERATGVNRETIRVYFRQGLLPQPQRSARNVADYGDVHVRGILSIRRMQEKGRVPLAQIKRALEGDPGAMPSDAGVAAQLEELVAVRLGTGLPLVPVARLVASNPHAAVDARKLHRVGAVTLRREKGRPALSPVDANLVKLWGEMRAAGFTESAGFTPAVVQIYVESAERLAKLESKTFFDALSGRSSEVAATRMAAQALSTMLEFFGVVRMKALRLQFKKRVPETRSKPKPRPVSKARPGSRAR